MRKNAMPEVKFERESLTDAEKLAHLHKECQRVADENDRLRDDMERQSELIAALRAESATYERGFAAASDALKFASQRIADLEQHLATKDKRIAILLEANRGLAEKARKC